MIDFSSLLQFIPVVATGMEILLGVSIGLALLGLGAGIYMVLAMPGLMKGKEQSLGDFSITGAVEGAPVPKVFGKVRLPGNILYYGNVVAHDVKEKAGKGKRVTVGFAYSIDLWQAICEGPDVTLHGCYYNDKPRTVDETFVAGRWTFNDGSSSWYPTPADAPYTNALNPIAHFWVSPWFLEVNAYTIGNVEFLVSRASDTGLTDENLDNGTNPAAVIYEVFKDAGAIPASDFVLSSFEEAASEWSDRGYGLNFKIQQHTELRDVLMKIRDWVDFSLYQDKNNQWVLSAWKDGESSVADLVASDFLSFKFKRTTHNKCYAKFTAKMIDEDQDFTERVIGIRATHLRELLTYEKPLDVDLSAFRDVDSASRRLLEIVKQYSFPFAEIEITTNLAYMDTIFPGNIITITNDDYGYTQTKFRVLSKDISEIDKNELGFTIRQYVDGIYEDQSYPAGGSSWTPPEITPEEALEVAVYEIPYNTDGSEVPRYAILAHRATDVHAGYNIYVSPDNVTYNFVETSNTWSCHCNLDVQYTTSTGYIDDDVGIVITPTAPAMDDLLESVSRGELFEPSYYCLIGTELMAYQTVTDLGGGQYRLEGIIRGLYNTTIATHNVASDVWLFWFAGNIITNVNYADFYIKIVPFISSPNRFLTIDDVTELNVTAEYKAQVPWPISRIEVVKSGSTNTVSVWPTPKTYTGAGAIAADVQTDTWPPEYDGELMYSTGGSYAAITSNPFVISDAGGFTLTMYHTRNGRSSSTTSVTVGAGDATYVGPDV